MILRYNKIKICLTDTNLELVEKIKNEMGFKSKSEAINYIIEKFSSNNNIENKVKDLTDKYIHILNDNKKNNSIKRINKNTFFLKNKSFDKDFKLEIDDNIITLDYFENIKKE